MMDELARLKTERDALNARISLIEAGIEKAAYDTCMNLQLVAVNERRISEGKPPLSHSQFASGCFEGDERHDRP